MTPRRFTDAEIEDAKRKPRRPSAARVLRYVRECLIEGVTEVAVLDGRRANRAVATVRWQVWARLRAEGYSYPGIALHFRLDHSTIVQAMQAVESGRRPFDGSGRRNKPYLTKPRRLKAPTRLQKLVNRVAGETPTLIRYAGYDRTERQIGDSA